MPMSKDQGLARMMQCGVVAVIRADSIAPLEGIAKACLAGGVEAIEVTMTTPKALAGIEKLADHFGDKAIIGVGTVLDSATCHDAIAAGAQFVVSPTFERSIVETTRRYGKISIPGAFTPTEIFTAWTAGGDVIKVFPATTLGPPYMRDLLAPLPQLRLTPTGGIDALNAGEWIKAGAVFVGAASSLLPRQAIARGDWAAITQKARTFIDAVREARASMTSE
jgi:2-dehydro-3-deoxyphosphogluconate aldolase/(4S)-4-hydroxy-2-oxoglutarate aldolase